MKIILKVFIFSTILCLVGCSSDKESSVSLNFTNDILLPHTPVRSQGRTTACWAYSMASMLESDCLTLNDDSVRLSVMYVVRQKYMRQFELYYYSNGHEEIRNGGLGHSFIDVWKQKGLMPREMYRGHSPNAKYHDHRALLKLLKSMAEKSVKEKNLSFYRKKAEDLLDEHMGEVPEHFHYKGQEYTPKSFADSLKINPDRYVELTSFTHHPFYTDFVLEVPDNWEHASFHNVSIDSLEQCVRNALQNGYTVVWDGDTSEEGFMASQGVALYPEDSVSQQERQLEFERFKTTDDHMMHIVGTAHDENSRFYYILKNSWGKIGPYKGFIYMSQEYFRAKTVSVVMPSQVLRSSFR